MSIVLIDGPSGEDMKRWNDAIDENYDLDGNTRKVDGDCDEISTVDMGCYEYQG